MDQLKKLFLSLSLKQRITLAIAAIAVAGSLLMLSRWNRERDFKPLYSGLSQEDAAAVVTKLRESGTEFRIGEGGSSVLAPSNKVAELRLQLAAAGVPKSGRIGYELFDKTNFGASDFAEQINFHRALEGELERSVMSISAVELARIHLTVPKDSIFLESRQPAKASVLIKLRPGAQLTSQNVAAICQLTANAVEGLAPEAVSVVDMRGNLLSRPRKALTPDGMQPDDALLDYRQKIERDLTAKINTTLEPLLGADKFRTGVSVDCDFSSGEQSEETFDPTKSVMVTSQKTEDISGSNSASGVPGTASNLPRPTSRPGTIGSGITRRTENIAYQSSRTVRRVHLPQGNLKRVSVSILLDNAVRFEGTGSKAKRLLVAPSPEKVKVIHDLVAGAIGLSVERGDQLVIESLPFESTLNPAPLIPEIVGAPAPTGLPSWLQNALKNKLLVAGAAGGTLVLILAMAGLLFMKGRKKKRQTVDIQTQLAKTNEQAKLDAEQNFTKQLESQMAEQSEIHQRQEAEALTALRMPKLTTKKAQVLTKHIIEESQKTPKMMAQVLRTWTNEPSH
ncbi:MAG: flagellar M-ring protein FliF [Acidobacteriota bacterium]|nr:flagellar M-ring protein FliF [Acidobacteriota bacterium]